MILTSVTKHVKEQNWFAVFVDFIIVVVGVFIGIQVANWNDTQAFREKEGQLLKELEREITVGIDLTSQRGESYKQVLEAGTKSLSVLSGDGECKSDCWNILVNFMHASQWQDIRINRVIYDEMRRQGLPRNRTIIESIEIMLAQNEGNAVIFDDKPIYRTKIRELLPFEFQEFYWINCYTYVGGHETYSLNCKEGLTNDIASKIVKNIVNQPQIKLYLTDWASTLVTLPTNFISQNADARKAIALIEAELKRR